MRHNALAEPTYCTPWKTSPRLVIFFLFLSDRVLICETVEDVEESLDDVAATAPTGEAGTGLDLSVSLSPWQPHNTMTT